MSSLVAAVLLVYAAGTLYQRFAREPLRPIYPSPDEAAREIEQLAADHPAVCERAVLGRSTEGREIHALRIRREAAAIAPRPRLLVTANIHAVEYIGGAVARAVARKLVARSGEGAPRSELLERADVWIVPLLNPDGAARIWRQNGFARMGNLRYTANGVDPNRNFPFAASGTRRGWNTASDRRGSAYYRGPHPLSEPECLALARLCKRERFCAAINFHSFGGVVFMPAVTGGDAEHAARALSVFQGIFQSHQPHLKYRPVPERSMKIQGQLDPFLLNAFGTPSVTVEVSRPRWHVLKPWRTFNPFWWANPERPDYWIENDADAAIRALAELVERTGGRPGLPANPELADAI